MISIIMPLYNAEKYLEEALDSILGQTFSDYELICINDASTDNTLRIIEKYITLDNRIVYHSNENRKGAAYSRNLGIQMSKGDYLCFLDGDDIFDQEMLYLANKCASENDLDVVLFEAMHVRTEDIYIKKTIKRSENFKKKYYRNSFNFDVIDYEDVLLWNNSPCNKLFRREFIKKNKIEFQSLPSSNDVFFVEMAFVYAERMRFLDDERVMVYARDHDVSTRISFSRDPFCTFEVARKLLKELFVRGGTDDMLRYAYLKMFFGLIDGLKKCKDEEKRKSFYSMLNTEGIDNLIEINTWIIGNDEILDLYLKFKESEYESRWFDEFNILDYKFEKMDPSFFDKLIGNNTVIWGIGNYGMALLRYFNKRNLKVESVVDRDANKIGKIIGGYIVGDAYEYDYANTNIIIVSSNKVYRDALQYLEKYNVTIISLCEVMNI